ncbi:MAG: hypothetical protein IE887_07505 [Campylobacterales bacterium]|nr:hypothetical protein [Campylobacterales bacterium]
MDESDLSQAIKNTTHKIIEYGTQYNKSFRPVSSTQITTVEISPTGSGKSDFVMINGTWEAKRDGLLKILTSLPLSYSWKIYKNTINEQFAEIHATLSVKNGRVTKIADAVGICEFSELKGNGGRHFMNARVETRALKRAIETIFGSVINYFVMKYLPLGR